MYTVARTNFTTIKTEGAILPADLLQRIAGGQGLDGLRPDDYHLAPNERLNEAINRSWNRCLGAWASFNDQRARLPESDTGTTLTRERWLLILFQEMGYGRLQIARGVQIEGTSYPISHLWGNVPIHLVSFRQDLDRRDGARASRSPHSLVQEYLNRAPDSLWGFVSNGLRLRVLRDNVSLTRAAYVEFDLEAMLNGELYADFCLLWLIGHQSRVEGEPASECWLERWSKEATEQGARALDALRDGVQEAIGALGRGFLAQPANRDLKAKLKSGELTAQDYYRQLLRLVYRLIFLFVAEDRNLLLLPGTGEAGTGESATRPYIRPYMQYYSAHRLRHMAEALRGGPHADLYRGLRLVFVLLREGYPDLGLPALGSFLFSDRATPDLDNAELPNSALLESIRALAFTIEGKVRRPVDYKNLGSIELGSVYESLLELHPILNADAATFEMQTGAGNERKTTGSHYTHPALVNELIESALEPVIAERLKATDDRGRQTADGSGRGADQSAREHAILSIKVADPACGSGHFLVAAAYRLARRLASVRTGDDEPSPDAIRSALRDVVGRCLYGVDINPMAVELCKVSLWLEALEPGKPLSFLDHHIQCGNSLIGATPMLLARGIPDEAFTPIEGDDKKVCAEFKKRNKKERQGARSLFDAAMQPWERLGDFAASMMSLDGMADDTLDGVRRKQERYEELVRSSGYEYGHLWADAWCAAFVWKKTSEFAYPITEEVFRQIERNPFNLAPWMRDEIKRLREQYQFFHWHLAFPDVFHIKTFEVLETSKVCGWTGGFDCVLGNPPWDRPKPEPAKFFTSSRLDISYAMTFAIRTDMLEKLATEDSALFSRWKEHERTVLGVVTFLTQSGLFRLTAMGKFNLGNTFVELSRNLLATTGRIGMLNVSGLATDDSGKDFIADIMKSGTLVSFYDFENRSKLFPAVHSSYKFSAITITGQEAAVSSSDFCFFAQNISDLSAQDRHISFTDADIRLLNPISGNCPVFRTQRDAELVKSIYRKADLLSPPNEVLFQWNVEPTFMFVMSDHSDLFYTDTDLELQRNATKTVTGKGGWLPLYESKMFHQFDHRWASVDADGKQIDLTIDGKGDPSVFARPRYWMTTTDTTTKLGNLPHDWLIAIRGITRPTDERTSIATVIPKYPVGHSAQVFRFQPGAMQACAFTANLNAFVFDFAARTKIGGANLSSFILRQLPILPQFILDESVQWNTALVLSDWIACRALELTYTAWDLQPFAQDCGYDGPPFRWDKERRFLLRCELDAAYFHLYGIAREDVDYIMETFPIVKRKDEAAHGEYRTKRIILDIYDAMQRAIESGRPYQTLLDPPPADARVAHPVRL